jgi:UDPglucose 6-dehydrogenase
MKICVYGLWHLGTVTAACLASRKIQTVGLTDNVAAAAELNQGRAPLYEPGLDELVARGIASGYLSFTSEIGTAVPSADVVWVAFDTPIGDDDVADVDYVMDRIRLLFPHVRDGGVILISSQLPVGSTARLENEFSRVAAGRAVAFAYSPEDLRLGQAIKAFTEPTRSVVGIRDEKVRNALQPLFATFRSSLLWMRVESAEMVKHALNVFLATSVTFTNEIATVCERVGADMSEIEGALRLDPRIGEEAYVRPGAAFGGGSLARDVRFLQAVAASNSLRLPVIDSVIESNDQHKKWVIEHLLRCLGTLQGKRIGVLGLAYKAGTDTTRRSIALELLEQLLGAGARPVAFDPKVTTLPGLLDLGVSIATKPDDVFDGAEAVIVATPWPEFLDIDLKVLATMNRKVLIDQNGFLVGRMSVAPDVIHIVAGKIQ